MSELRSFDLANEPLSVGDRTQDKSTFGKIGYRYPLFYSGDQCLRYLIREILEPVEAGSEDIKIYDGCCANPINFCSDASIKH